MWYFRYHVTTTGTNVKKFSLQRGREKLPYLFYIDYHWNKENDSQPGRIKGYQSPSSADTTYWRVIVDYRCATANRPKRISPRPNPIMIAMMYAAWNVLGSRDRTISPEERGCLQKQQLTSQLTWVHSPAKLAGSIRRPSRHRGKEQKVGLYEPLVNCETFSLSWGR